MKTIIYTKLTDMFLQEWEQLWNDSDQANYVNSPQWFVSILETFTYKTYHVIAVYKQHILVAVAPFVTEKKYGATFHTMPPGNFVYGAPFLLQSNNSVLIKALCKEIEKLGNVFIENIPGEIITNVKMHIPGIDVTFITKNHYLSFTRDENNQVTIPNRKKLLRKIKGLEEKWHLVSYTGEDIEALDIVYTIDDQSRKHSRGYSTFADDSTRTLYRSFAKQFKKHFQIFILYFEKKPVAYRLGFLINNIYYGSQTSFLNDYQHYWPGNVLLVKVIDYLDTIGVHKIDFGSGDTYSKRSVANGSRTLKHIIISRNVFMRNYLHTVYFLKNILFDYLVKNASIYSVYRTIKNTFIR